MNKTDIFAAYLPQFHRIPENDMFWGKGFTDWSGVRNAKPLFVGHNQPRIPLNGNYYDLTNIRSIEWQVELANKYGVDGFCIYHYWFKNGHKVLEKPAEIIRDHDHLNIKYFFCWDNCSWVRTWGNISGNAWAPKFDENKSGSQLLLEYDIGEQKDWHEHFLYLLPFFLDARYQKIDNKPVFVIMRESSHFIRDMCKYWDEKSKMYGFNGMHFIASMSKLRKNKLLDYHYTYEPIYSSWGVRESIEKRLESWFHINIKHSPVKYIYDYESVWRRILKTAKNNMNKNVYPCGLVNYDDTPRRGEKAHVITGASPKLFEKYFSELYKIANVCNKKILFLTAWNEWGEGAYLEPDRINEYEYLEALRSAKNCVIRELNL